MNVKRQKPKHIIVSYENFEKLRKFGYANDSMNDVITKILEKNSKWSESDELPTLESDSDCNSKSE